MGKKVSGILRQALIVLLALGVLGTLVPTVQAMPSDAGYVADSDDCCNPPLARICEQKSPVAGEQALTPSFAAVIAEPDGRSRTLAPRQGAAPSALPVAHAAGPPAYLRYHRFLL
jgi:hypothetical protein